MGIENSLEWNYGNGITGRRLLYRFFLRPDQGNGTQHHQRRFLIFFGIFFFIDGAFNLWFGSCMLLFLLQN